MEKKKPKQSDSKIVGAIVWSFSGILLGIFAVITKKDNAFVGFVLAGIALIYLIYLLRKTKNNTNERYEDERKKFVSDKSKSIFKITIINSNYSIFRFYTAKFISKTYTL